MVDILLYNGIYPPVSSNVAMRNPRVLKGGQNVEKMLL